jgi:acetate kinase
VHVLVLNVGSSTLKFQLIRTDAERIAANTDERLARGQIERIGGEAVLTLEAGQTRAPRRTVASLRNHAAAVDHVLRWLTDAGTGSGIQALGQIEAVGHRVVHGGEHFTRSVLVDADVLRRLDETIDLAPLHNPHNLSGIRAVQAALGAGVPQVASFDTAFHHTLPEVAYLYALPYQYYRRYQVRRYGFHGTSHRYVAHRYRQLTGRTREQTNLVTLHLGNGCSACAIKGGRSVDTSMGFTPLEGLVMGTRSGDLDPAILDYVAAKEGLSLPQVEAVLNKSSGLLGVSGLTPDMRELLAEAAEHDDRRLGSRSRSSLIGCGSTSAPTSPPWTGRRRSCSPEASERTRHKCAPTCARGWAGSGRSSTRSPTPRPSADARDASTRGAAGSSSG